MSQVNNLQILIDALQNVKQEEIEREKEERDFRNRLAGLEAEIALQRNFIQQLHLLTEKYLNYTL